MRVFVTGATGFIGSVVVPELIKGGHNVLGLARSDASAKALSTQGAEIHRGELSDPASLVAGARTCDGVIHLAFIHDFTKFAENVETDRIAVTALADALAGTNRPFIITSGAGIAVGKTMPTEADAAPSGMPRGASEEITLAAAGRGVRSMVMRLPPTVHGAGDKGFVPMLVDVARAKGVSAYVGDGAIRWSAVHRSDAARLYRLALEKGAAGTRLHAVAEESIPTRKIAEAIGEGLGVPVKSVSPEEAQAHFGWFAMFIAMERAASSEITRETFGWRPEGPDLLTDMRENYFARA